MSKITERGQHAENILQDPLVVDALKSIEQVLRDSWDNATSTEVREELWYTLKGMQRFKHYFTVAIEQGEFETALKEKANAAN